MMAQAKRTEAFVCDAVRTPFGRYGGALSGVRTDDLAALPLRALQQRNPGVDWSAVDDVCYGCANQAGEDNRNVARMAALLAGLPQSVPAATLNRLCGSSLDATITAARAIQSGGCELVIAGGVESMSRAPYVMAKAESAFARGARLEDTTLGWRFVNPQMEKLFGCDSMAQTAENLVAQWDISRADQGIRCPAQSAALRPGPGTGFLQTGNRGLHHRPAEETQRERRLRRAAAARYDARGTRPPQGRPCRPEELGHRRQFLEGICSMAQQPRC